jgi:hypothetical protein
MSIILKAVTIREALRAPKLASLYGDVRARRPSPRILAAAAVLALIVVAAGVHQLRPEPPLQIAEADIPMLPPTVRRPADLPPARAPQPTPPVVAQVAQVAVAPAAWAPAQRRAVAAPVVAAFRPPTTLSQPIPTPVALLSPGQTAGRVPPPPGSTGAAPMPDFAEPVLRAAAAPVFQPLSDLPQAVRQAIERVRVHVHLYAPLARHRLVMVEGRQLREGDDVMDGVRLDEIKPQGLVLRHGSIRVLLTTPFARPQYSLLPAAGDMAVNSWPARAT